MNGAAVYSCSQLALWADGAEITTIEGLAQGDHLHPLQQAFAELDGGQCNYCIPGQIMAAKALLDRNPAPSVDEVRVGMSGNLCRCANYNHIQDAVLHASQALRGEAAP
jgi:aerobic-type carbon monoxide dehydrogenase small subunit (CoxS/CutS family)